MVSVNHLPNSAVEAWRRIGDSGRLAVFVVAILCFRLYIAVAAPMIPQEAYHWAYAIHPDLSYFDHPPLVGWAIGLGVALVGSNLLGLRLFTLLFALATTLIGLAWVRDLGGDARTQRMWLVATVAVPIFGLGMNLAMIEGPLCFGWMLTVWALWRARQGGMGWWLLAGLGAGIALLSKYTAVFLLPAGLLLAGDQLLRRQLRRSGPWLACLVAAVCFTPVAIWNARHDWASFRFQVTSHYGGHPPGAFGTLELIVGQLAVLMPLTAVALVAAVVWFGRSVTADPRAVWILSFGVPLPLFMALVSPWVVVKLNWLVPAYLTLVIGAILWFVEHQSRRPVRFWSRAIWWNTTFGVLAVLASPLARLAPAAWGNNWSGWHSIATAAERWEEVLDSERGNEEDVFFFVDGVNEAAALEYWLVREHAEPSPLEPVLAQNAVGARALAYDYWTSPKSLTGRDAVGLLPGDTADRRDKLLAKMRRCFRSVDFVEEVEVQRLGMIEQRVAIWLCRGYDPP